MCCSVQPRNQLFFKGYEFLPFAENMGKNIGKKISKNISSKYSQKLLDHAKLSATDVLKTASKNAIIKIAEVTGDLTGNKIVDKNLKISKTSWQDNSEAVTNEHGKEINKKRYISPEKRQKIINDLKLIQLYNNMIVEYQKLINLLDNKPNRPTKFGQKIGLK